MTITLNSLPFTSDTQHDVETYISSGGYDECMKENTKDGNSH